MPNDSWEDTEKSAAKRIVRKVDTVKFLSSMDTFYRGRHSLSSSSCHPGGRPTSRQQGADGGLRPRFATSGIRAEGIPILLPEAQRLPGLGRPADCTRIGLRLLWRT